MTSVPNSKLGKMFNVKNDANLLRIDGKVFINRDPDNFKVLIKYLRSNQPQNEIPEDLLSELFYWELPI